MKYFWYSITDDEIKDFLGEVSARSAGFIKSAESLGGVNVYYKSKDGKLIEVIGEAIHEQAARRRIEEFLSTFNVNIF
jgi:hypothetical protein